MFFLFDQKALIRPHHMARTAEGRAGSGGCGLGDSSMKADGGDDSEDDHASTDEGRPLTQEDAEVVKRTPCRAQSFAAVALVSICALLVVGAGCWLGYGWAAAQTAGLSTPPRSSSFATCSAASGIITTARRSRVIYILFLWNCLVVNHQVNVQVIDKFSMQWGVMIAMMICTFQHRRNYQVRPHPFLFDHPPL